MSFILREFFFPALLFVLLQVLCFVVYRVTPDRFPRYTSDSINLSQPEDFSASLPHFKIRVGISFTHGRAAVELRVGNMTGHGPFFGEFSAGGKI